MRRHARVSDEVRHRSTVTIPVVDVGSATRGFGRGFENDAKPFAGSPPVPAATVSNTVVSETPSLGSGVVAGGRGAHSTGSSAARHFRGTGVM